jgi:hypothetical protein
MVSAGGHKQPHALLYKAIVDGLSEEQCADKLDPWAAQNFGFTPSHSAGEELGNPNRQL